jgi:hypothetical protein
MQPAPGARSGGTRSASGLWGLNSIIPRAGDPPGRPCHVPVCVNATRHAALPPQHRAASWPAVLNRDRASFCADSSTHAQTKGGPIRIRPSFDALSGPQGSGRENPSSRDFAGRIPAPEISQGDVGPRRRGVKQGGGLYEGGVGSPRKGILSPLPRSFTFPHDSSSGCTPLGRKLRWQRRLCLRGVAPAPVSADSEKGEVFESGPTGSEWKRVREWPDGFGMQFLPSMHVPLG